MSINSKSALFGALTIAGSMLVISCAGTGDTSALTTTAAAPSGNTLLRCGTVDLPLAKQMEIQKLLSSRVSTLAPGVVTIPVYFHVITKGTGVANGDVPQSWIDAQINVLNAAYNGGSGGTATRFQFTLVSVDRTNNRKWFTTTGGQAEAQMKNALRQG